MMDRMDPVTGTFDHDSRRRHWHDLVRTWNAALDRHRPDTVIFSMAPHIVYDWALYALCKLRGVPTLMFERTSIPGRLLLLRKMEDGIESFAEAMQHEGGADEPLSRAAQRHIEGLRRGGEAALPANYRKKLVDRGLLRQGGRQGALSTLGEIGFEAARAGYVGLRRKSAPPNYLLKEAPDGRLVSPSGSEWLWMRWAGQAKKKRLNALLARLAREPDADRPSILLALHYQPERAIVPMAGLLGDQTLIVDMLASALPQGWQLLVKEHPWQLAEMGRGDLGRSAGFFRRICDNDNVVLCRPELDTTALLDRSAAVATATGSIGWQAIARGKPVLVFGAAWYRGCPGSYTIHDVASCREAMQDITNGKGVPPNAAERTMAAVEAVSIVGYLEPGLEDVGDVAEGDAVSGMAGALAAAMRS
jgi:hypothetical protein